jgi:hypothetical protein
MQVVEVLSDLQTCVVAYSLYCYEACQQEQSIKFEKIADAYPGSYKNAPLFIVSNVVSFTVLAVAV